MQNPLPLPEPHFLRFVQDFETLSNLLQTRLERERRANPSSNEADLFATEWQMTAAGDALASR